MAKTGSFSGRYVQWTIQKVADILRNLLDHSALSDACGQKNQLYRLTYLVHAAKHTRSCDHSGRTATR